MIFMANVDILMLYAVCGLALTLLVRLPAPVLAAAGIAAVYLPTLLPLGPSLPAEAELRLWAANATGHYGHDEASSTSWPSAGTKLRELIAPLLIESAQNTAGMMLLGLSLWRLGVIPPAETLSLSVLDLRCNCGNNRRREHGG